MFWHKSKETPAHNQYCLVKSPSKQPDSPHVSLCVFKRDSDGNRWFVLGTNYQSVITLEEATEWRAFYHRSGDVPCTK